MRKSLTLVLATLIGLAFAYANFPNAGASGSDGTAVSSVQGGHDEHMMEHSGKCAAKAADCMRECASCSSHCAHLVAGGKKEHVKTMTLCQDCADICGAASKIFARFGPLAIATCEPCAKACDTCAEACEKIGGTDKHMAQCAKACRDCAKECRTMVKHAAH